MSDLQCETNEKFHRREWALQRISWVLMLAFLCAGAAGYFGKGPLSHATARGKLLNVKYERYERHGAPSSIEISWSQTTPQSLVRISFEREYLDGIDLQHIIPQPVRVVAAGDRSIFEFAVDSTATQQSIAFNMQPHRLGRRETWITLVDTDSIRISQFVYP